MVKRTQKRLQCSTWKPHDGDDDGGGDGYDLVQRCQQNVGDPHGANFYLCPPD